MKKEDILKRIDELVGMNSELSFEIRRLQLEIADYEEAIAKNDEELKALRTELCKIETLERPIDMSFYYGTLNKEILKAFIEKTDKPIRYTYGLKYRNPTTLNVPVSKERALQIVDSQPLLDAKELDDCLDLNAYSDNDMW